MSYFINPVDDAACVFLTHEGELSLAEAETACQEAARLLAEKRWTRMLVDVGAVRSIPKGLELMALGEAMAQTLPRNAQLALVVRTQQTKHARLLEQVARKGGVFVTFFIDAEKAEQWLSKPPPATRGGLSAARAIASTMAGSQNA